MDQNEIVTRLSQTPLMTIEDALAKLDVNPAAHGIYTWWLPNTCSLPRVPTTPHPEISAGLLYVGIGPSSARSRRTLRQRFKDHTGGTPGSSTLRRSLASLLWSSHHWKPIWTSRATLGAADNGELTQWMRSNLRVQWAEIAEPWLPESEIIAAMSPPLNLGHNKSHPFYPTLKTSRTRFTATARSNRASHR